MTKGSAESWEAAVGANSPIEIKVAYSQGIELKEEWASTPWHCLMCGEKTVWLEIDTWENGRHIHFCTSCKALFYLPTSPEICTGNDGETRRRALIQCVLARRLEAP